MWFDEGIKKNFINKYYYNLKLNLNKKYRFLIIKCKTNSKNERITGANILRICFKWVNKWDNKVNNKKANKIYNLIISFFSILA